jgi:2,4-diketo-3-deoxy-L-fuconate hydrolase
VIEIADVNNLSMWLDVNGKRMQTGATKTMIFNCSHLLHDISQYMVLRAGDVVTTGTTPAIIR